MNRKYFRIVILVGLLSLIGIQSYSQGMPYIKEHNSRRHKGFFLSYAPGLNYTNVEMTGNYGTTTVKGLGGGMDLKIGGTLTENLILHATIIGHGVFEPKLYGDGIQDATTAQNVDLGEVMLGVGITYYTPDNFLFSTSMGLGGFTLTNEEEDIDGSSDNGFSFQLKAGKEWWVSRKLGLGLAVIYHYTNVLNLKGSVDEERLVSNTYGILLNATINGRK